MIDLKRERDVVIVGAGPAGAAAAFWLARQGLDVLILESKRLPRAKPCGDGLGPRAILELRELGLEDWLKETAGHRILRVRIVSPSGDSLEAGAEPELFPVDYGRVVRRQEFDHALVKQAVAAGAELVDECRAVGLLSGQGFEAGPADRAGGVAVQTGGRRRQVKAKLVVAASGSKGRLAGRQYGPSRARGMALRTYAAGVAGIDDCVNLYFSQRFPYGYGWIFPTGPATANIGVGLLRRNQRADGDSLQSAFAYFIKEQNLAPLSLDNCTLAGRPVGSVMRMDFRRSEIQRPGLASVGDAVGLVSPLNGEGISHALESARLLGKSLENKFVDARRVDEGLRAYERTLRARFSTYFLWADLIGRLLAKPERLDRLVAQAKKHAAVRLALAGALTNTAHPREFGRLRVISKLLF